jgi:hypothetical protein
MFFMSAILDERDQKTDNGSVVEMKYVNEDGRPNTALLQDRTPQWMQSSTPVVWLTLVLCLLYLFTSVSPLWHTDVWGHLSYGRWIVQHGRVPTVEPLLPLSQGMTFLDLPWLSQLIGYGMVQQFGISGLQFLNALGVVALAGIFTFAVYSRTRNLGAALLTLVAIYVGSYQQLLVFRPQLAGMVCFAAVFAMGTASRWRSWYLLAIPVVFAFWANLHGSFIMGLGLLGALTVGRAADVLVRTRKWKYVFAERGVRGLFLATELSLLAILLNPYGIAVYPEVFAVAGNKNLESLIEWDPLTLRMKQGRVAFAMALGLVTLYRFSPRRVSIREVLLLCGLGAASLWHSRMIAWWAPVAAYYLGLHLAACWRHWRGPRKVEPARGGLWTVIALGLAWIAFAYSPFGVVALHGQSSDPQMREKRYRASVSPLTPIDITDYLNRHVPKGLVFNSYEWGDYLLWAGPKGIQVFVNSHAHLVSQEVWQDYFTILRTLPGWEEKLKRYGVNTMVLDKDQKELIAAMEKLTDWEKKFSDSKGSVFVRKQPV